jgi:hypothetical protein
VRVDFGVKVLLEVLVGVGVEDGIAVTEGMKVGVDVAVQNGVGIVRVMPGLSHLRQRMGPVPDY